MTLLGWMIHKISKCYADDVAWGRLFFERESAIVGAGPKRSATSSLGSSPGRMGRRQEAVEG